MNIPPVTWSGAFERLRGFRKLKKDWDSYGADPPSEAVCSRVEEILKVLQSIGWEPPSVVPCVDGNSIQLEWHSNGRDEEWEIYIE